MAEKKIAKVTLNGEKLIDISEDTVTPEVLAESETAHDRSGEGIVGTAQFGGSDCYKTTDAVGTIDDADYIPFNDVSDAEVPKKKTLFSAIVDKLKTVFAQKTELNRDLNQSVAHTGKNLLPQLHPADGHKSGDSWTNGGITWTINNDGSITANGTATSDIFFTLADQKYRYMLPKGNYILTGCPSGGASDKYYIYIQLMKDGSSSRSQYNDYGSGVNISLDADARMDENSTGSYSIKICNGVTVSNIVFKPMIRHAYTDETYEKYIPNGQDVKGVVYVGTCTTAADQQVKVVNVDSDFRLKKGARIAVKFSNTNTYSSTTAAPCQLNVNSTGAKNLYYNSKHSGEGNTGTLTTVYGSANRYIYYFYDGSYWVWDGYGVEADTSYPVYDKTIDANYKTNYRTETKGDTAQGAYLSMIRQNTADVDASPQYSSGLAFGRGDTHGYFMLNYSNADAFIGGGNANELKWTSELFHTSRPPIVYCTCGSSASNAIKGCSSVGLPTVRRIKLFAGMIIGVLFSNSNTASNVQIEYGGETHTIRYQSATYTGDAAWVTGLAGTVIFYMYNGSEWVWITASGLHLDLRDAITADQISAGTDTTNRVVRADYLRVGIRNVMDNRNIVPLSGLRLREIEIPDNSGYAKYLLLHEVTEWYNSTTTQQKTQGFSGWIVSRRTSGTMYNYICEVKACVSWQKETSPSSTGGKGVGQLLLEGTHEAVRPCILKDPYNNYYLAIRFTGSGRQAVLFGTWVHNGDRNTNWLGYVGTWINCTDSNLTLPSGYSVAINGRGNSSPVKNITRNANVITATRQDDTTFSLTEATGLYGTCTTAASERIKVVTLSGFALTAGATIHVKFTNTNTYNSQTANPIQLNVNGTGAKNIWYWQTHSGAGNTGTNATVYGVADRYNTYMYDGTYWVWMGTSGEADTTDPRNLGFGYGTCDTAAATAAKVVTLGSYILRTGGYVSVRFTYDVPANATMNINTRGAKPIWYRNAAITAGKIKAGDMATFLYDGTNYRLVANDRWGG